MRQGLRALADALLEDVRSESAPASHRKSADCKNERLQRPEAGSSEGRPCRLSGILRRGGVDSKGEEDAEEESSAGEESDWAAVQLSAARRVGVASS